jgi:branched-chain amino acid transport system permease protein
VAALGPSYRNLFAFVILIAVLVWRPNGLFAKRQSAPPEPLTGTFIPNKKTVSIPPWASVLFAAMALLLPLFVQDPYLLQVLTNAWLLGMIALSVTLATGIAGQVSLGQAGFVAIGAYTSALLTQRLGWSFEASLVAAAIISACFGVLLTFPAFRLRAHYMAIATLAIGEIVNQVILNAGWLTNGPLGITNISPPSFFGWQAVSARDVYWYSLALLLVSALLQWRLVASPLGRTWRAMRDDEIAAQSSGINLSRYKALAFAASALIAGISGAFTAHMYTYINQETFIQHIHPRTHDGHPWWNGQYTGSYRRDALADCPAGSLAGSRGLSLPHLRLGPFAPHSLSPARAFGVRVAMPLLELTDVSRNYDGVIAVNTVSLRYVRAKP